MPPRLLYVGDVPVESSYHGSALLYRLLQGYPADRLQIVEGSLFPAKTDRRLPGVTHHTLDVGRPRLLHTRFHTWYSRWLLRGARGRAARLRAIVERFNPEAVFTVGHGYSWLTAAELARGCRLPLHFLVHDDWPRVIAAPLAAVVDREFGNVYRQAATRFCSSPFMNEEYQRRYDAPGTLLLPYRAADAPRFPGVAERLREHRGPPVYAFAGTINSPGYAALLRSLAEEIEQYSSELLIYGPITLAQAASAGLNRANVRLGGLLQSDELLRRLRIEADVLFVPMSFAAQDRANMRMGFPSKLTDYTAAGLPLLIMGPPDCSAVCWAQQHDGVAEVVASDAPGSLADAIGRLAGDADHRVRLAERALELGARQFSAERAQRLFLSAVESATAH